MTESAVVSPSSLIKGAPPYLVQECIKCILGDEYCFRTSCEGCPQTNCKSEPAHIDVNQEPNVRKAFVARPGYVLAAVDYSGVELRIAANLSKEPVWVNAFNSGADLHGETAKVIFGPTFSKQDRQTAKCVRRGTKVKFRVLSSVQDPNSTSVSVQARWVTTAENTSFPLLTDAGIVTVSPLGKMEHKLAQDLVVGDFLVEVRSQANPVRFVRPQSTLAHGNKYMQKGMTITQIKVIKQKELDGMLVTQVEDRDLTLFGTEVTQDIDFAHTDVHRPGEFVPLHNLQVWTQSGWQTAAFLYFDGLQDFWTVKTGPYVIQGTGRHLMYTRTGQTVDWTQMQHLDPATQQVLVEENGSFVWKSFKVSEPEKLTRKAVRRTEEDNRPYKTRDQMFDIVVPVGHEYVANSFVIHNTCNFSNLYGGSPHSLAGQANIPLPKAKDIWSRWWKALPKLKEWYEQVCASAKAQGYVKTAFGRRRSLKEWYDGTKKDISFADRSSVNTVVQGSAADIMKRALAALWKYIVDHDLQQEVRLLLAVHDEIVFEIREADLQKHLDWILPIMTQTPKGWVVPLQVDCEIGYSWGEVADYKELSKENSPIVKFLRNPKDKKPDATTTQTTASSPVSEIASTSTVSVNTSTSASDAHNEPPSPESVFYIEKKLWHKTAITKIRQALLASPGKSVPIFQIGEQTLKDSRLPLIDIPKFTSELEKIKSEYS